MPTYRARHWTDIDHPSISQQRQRRIGNHINYITPGGLILPTNANVQASSAPADWVGQWDFRDFSGEAPLQFAAHDTTDSDNRAMVGLRIDDTPDVWINWKAMDVVPGVSTTSPDSLTREWSGLWTNSTLRWVHAGHFAKKEIVLSAAGHPASFRFSAKTSPGATWEVTDNILILRQSGVSKMVTKPVYGLDANENYIRATLSLDDTWGPGGIYPIVRITPNADDLAGATYPVTIDPTTNIPETALDDNWILDGGVGERNYGGSVSLYCNTDIDRQILLRLDDTLIPAGTITDVNLNITMVSSYTIDWDTYKIAVGNYGWVEGTANAAPQTGSSCYYYYAYDATTPTNWAGSAGLRTATTDYITDASPPNIAGTLAGAQVYALGTDGASWVTDWRDTPTNNAGHIIRPNSATNAQIHSTESGTVSFRPNYDIDYVAAAGQPTFIRWAPPHVAGKLGLFRGRY